jgi:hypothetical protein
MNGTAEHIDCKVETYNYRDDFQLLTRKEKRTVLRNAKYLLKLQRDNDSLIAVKAVPKREKDNDICVLRQVIL